MPGRLALPRPRCALRVVAQSKASPENLGSGETTPLFARNTGIMISWIVLRLSPRRAFPARLTRFIVSEDHMMRCLSARQVRSLVLTFWFFGLCLLSGCGSGDSGGSGASGAESARMKKFEEIKAKNAAAKQSKK